MQRVRARARSVQPVTQPDCTANYRRLCGDLHWAYDTPTDGVVSYLPSPALLLRTCKSEVCVGVDKKLQEAAAAADADWVVSGKWGLMQFVRERARGGGGGGGGEGKGGEEEEEEGKAEEEEEEEEGEEESKR